MSYKIGGGFSDTQDNLKNFSQKGSSNDSGPYIAVIKNTVDPLKMGRLGVVIPDIYPKRTVMTLIQNKLYGVNICHLFMVPNL